MTSDLELLQNYVKNKSEESFAALVNRHLNLVYSAALRQVRSPQLAEEVAQSTFTDLASSAHRLAPDTILAAWLYQVAHRTAINVVRREARRQLREQVACELTAMNATTADWTHIAPLLDEAMHALDNTDRTAVLLRYFENKSLREVGQTLGVSDDAAQKRVGRAVERLREFFTKRGITIGASTLVVILSANAVLAAPITLFTAITTATALTGTITTATATQAVAMTTLQKTLIATALAAAVGVGIYESRQSSNYRSQFQTAQQQQRLLSEQITRLTQERDDAMHRLASIGNGNQSSNQNSAQLLKLRAEVTRLRNEQDRLAQLLNEDSTLSPDPMEMRAKLWMDKVRRLKEKLEQNPGKSIPELKYLSDQDWLEVVKDADVVTDWGYKEALARLRKLAKDKFAPRLSRALREYARANNNELPPDTAALKPYFASPVEDAVLERYQLLHTGPVKWDEWVLAEKAPADDQKDTIFKVGPTGLQFSNSSSMGESGSQMWGTNDPPLSVIAQSEASQRNTSDEELKSFTKSFMEDQANARDGKVLDQAFKAFSAANPGQEPKSPNEIKPYLQTTAEKDAFDRLIKRNNVSN
ncbi:RNA polymerase sigma factor [Pedosphaera parvula]|uniref:RNA polymerase, sigma-24 subunit, ECF subfamily n=1 Tax=Pedosphaera parvula (strain Ellin514) TaxID=320771 RepID=B9XBI2_PEDPL|nr:sigma-70 family RNA polymerase sigma factor [Pedosphaera parvula]EEF62867.1 RNA polymerase, sigma-24 subunit, ECF subfamily [Pedosphaera parvula Ellin514]